MDAYCRIGLAFAVVFSMTSEIRSAAGNRLFLFLAPAVALATLLLVQAVAEIRYGASADATPLALGLYLGIFVLIGAVCHVLQARFRDRRAVWLLFIVSTFPACYFLYQAWLGSASALEQQAWTAAALSLGLGWMLTAVAGGLGLLLSYALACLLFRRDRRGPAELPGGGDEFHVEDPDADTNRPGSGASRFVRVTKDRPRPT